MSQYLEFLRYQVVHPSLKWWNNVMVLYPYTSTPYTTKNGPGWGSSRKETIYSRLSLSRSRRDPLKHFEISIRTSTYQICRIEENTNWTTEFHKWTYNLTPLVRNICWKYCGKGEKLLLRSNFSSYSQYFLPDVRFLSYNKDRIFSSR